MQQLTDSRRPSKTTAIVIRVLVAAGVVLTALGFLPPQALAGSYFIFLTTGAGINGGAGQTNTYDSRDDTPLGLTANSVSSSVTGTDPNSGTGVETGQASAAASLAQGVVRASAAGTQNGTNYASGEATAELSDTLTFSIPGATASTITQIGITMQVDGISSGTGPNASGDWDARLEIGGQSYLSTCCVFSYEVQSTYQPNPMISGSTTGWDSSSVTNGAVNGVDFSGTFSVIGSAPQITIEELLEAEGGGGALNDFYNTAFLNSALPPDVTFSSASGVFLSSPLSSLLEPPPIAILATAMLGIAALRRHFPRKQQQVKWGNFMKTLRLVAFVLAVLGIPGISKAQGCRGDHPTNKLIYSQEFSNLREKAHDSPHLSDRSENICEDRLVFQHAGEALHQRT